MSEPFFRPKTNAPALEAYIQTSPPHIHSGDSVSVRNWSRVAALLPVLAAALALGFPGFLKTAFLGIAAAAGFDWLVSGFFRRRSGLANGDTALTGILLVLLLPAKSSAGSVMFAAFMATVVANGFFGGLGGRLFNAAAFGCGALELVFPGSLAGSITVCTAGHPWMSAAIGLSAALLLLQRQVYWEAWLYGAGIFSAGGFFFGHGPGAFAAATFAMLLILSDPSTLPMTRRGTNLFMIGAALLAVLFGNGAPMAAAIIHAVLIMNCVSPWLEAWFAPNADRPALGKTGRLRPVPPPREGPR